MLKFDASKPPPPLSLLPFWVSSWSNRSPLRTKAPTETAACSPHKHIITPGSSVSSVRISVKQLLALMGCAPLGICARTSTQTHRSTNEMKINKMHFSVAVRKQRITERQKIRLENVVFIMRICACAPTVFVCTCDVLRLLRQINTKGISDATETGSIWIMHPFKSVPHQRGSKNWMKEKKDRTTRRGAENTRVIISAVFEVLDYNHLILICCLLLQERKKREGEAKREMEGNGDKGAEKKTEVEERRQETEAKVEEDMKWDEEKYEEQRKWSQRRWTSRETERAAQQENR